MTTLAAIDARLDMIRAGAVCRRHLGQTAGYLLLPAGVHQVSILDPTTRRLRMATADTLENAIKALRR